MVTTTNEIVCIVAGCTECGKAVIYKYVKAPPNSSAYNPQTNSWYTVSSGIPVAFSGIPVGGLMNDKPDVEWCECGTDEPRYLCKVGSYDIPGFLDKCDNCRHKFICASSRIEVIYEGVR